MTTNSSRFASFIVWYHIVSHGAICFCDYTQWIPLVDFVKRHDGSASDPRNLLPLELVYTGVTAMSFGTVGFAFVLAELGQTSRSCAALLSIFFHGLWVLHMLWRWEAAWSSMMHPEGTMQPQFFLVTHGVWAVLSIVLLVMPSSESEKKNKEDPKRK